MITSPSFYRTIQTPKRITKTNTTILLIHLIKRHAAKVVVCTALFILLFTSFLLIGTSASGNAPADATVGEHTVIVYTGDTLWEIAKMFSDDSDDIRYVVFKIKDRNGLQSATIQPGQKLIIPRI